MEGISKKRLEEIAEDYPPDHRNHRMAKYLIATECKELQEPWIPIDENTPRDRFLLCWIDDLQSKYILKFSTIRNIWLDQGLRPFMEPDLYQELPDDPIMPIHKPEPPK